ncbi:MAG: SMP-30/gluconolactonase/LRE family protein, partial [Woeseiaceae bacterium]
MRRTARVVLPSSILVLQLGCATSVGVDQLAQQPSPQWPPAPDNARVTYLYSITMPADAQIRRGFFGRAWRFIKGASAEGIARPQAIHVDGGSRLYIVDTVQKRIHVFDSAGSEYYWFPKEPEPGFEFPVGIAADGKGRVYVSDASSGVIHVFDSYGKKYLTAIGETRLSRPTGLAVRPNSGDLLVVDTLASSVVVFDTRNFREKRRTGYSGEADDALHYPTDIALASDGSVYVTDSLNFRIQILNADLDFEARFGDVGDGPGFFSRPKGVAVDSDGNIYVVDALFDNVQIFNR